MDTNQEMPTVSEAPDDVMVPTMIRLRPSVRERLIKIAKSRGMTLSAYLRWIAEEQVCYAEAA